MNDQHDFRDRLVSSQQLTPEYREKYERSLESMLTRRLTSGERITRTVTVVFSLVFIVGAILGFVPGLIPIVSSDITSYLGLMVILFIAVVLAITIVNIRCLITGVVDLRRQPPAVAWAAFWGIMLASAIPIVLGFIYTDRSAEVHLLLVCVILLIAAGVNLVLVYTGQSELNVREKLLEIELRLAEMSENRGKKQ